MKQFLASPTTRALLGSIAAGAITWAVVGKASDAGLALDTYRCDQFLTDAEHPSAADALLRTMMIVSWAAGYAASYENSTARSDKGALELTAAALGRICQAHRDQLVTAAFVNEMNDVLARGPSSPKPPDGKSDQSFVTYLHRDLPGNDLRMIKDSTELDCSTACTELTECKAYTFDRWNQFCLLKNGIGSLLLSPKSVSAVKRSISQPQNSTQAVQVDHFIGKAFTQLDFEVNGAVSLQDCENNCRAIPACLAYSFFENIKICRFFEHPAEYVGYPTAVSGAKVQKQ